MVAAERMAGPRAERVMVVEDEAIVSRDIQRMLREAGHHVTAAAGSCAAARAWLERETPDLALVDIALPEGRMAGIELASDLRGRGVRVVFVTAHADRETITRASHLGPSGYLVKPFTETQLLTAVEFALIQKTPDAAHGEAMTKAIAGIEARLGRLTSMLVEAGIAPASPGAAEAASQRVQSMRQLSSREREVLRQLLANRRVPQIADKLFISQHTVRTHLKSIFRKLNVHSQAELIDLLTQDHDPTL